MNKAISSKIVSLIFSVLVICFAIGFYVYAAWTEPTEAPPGGNVDAPLNVGSAGQSKIGGLILNTGGFPNGLIIDQGNVGIGTTDPSYKLHVDGSGSDTEINIDAGSDTKIAALRFQGVGTRWLIYKDNTGNPSLFFQDGAGTKVFTIQQGGNVGIGTTSPGSNKLEVVGGPIKATGGLIIETRTSDPVSPATGQMWLRTDL